LNALSLTARQELEKDHITVSILCPGIVDTEFGKRGATPEPDFLRYAPDGSVLPHVLSPESVAKDMLKLLESGEAELVM
jgi:short-subunit dehydrogenase